jgi:predicted enzyme related to lactoylglutathione lyase
VEIDEYPEGTPCWFDLGAPDLTAAVDFYSALFGWEVELGPPETGHYSMARIDGRDVAGLADQQGPGPAAWSTYLAVDDLDATLARAVEHGALVLVGPTDVSLAGRFAVVADPGGAVVSFWQAVEHHGAGRIGEPGCVLWSELTTRAVEPSLEFYRAVVGLTAELGSSTMGDYYELRRSDGRTVAGLMAMSGDGWDDEVPNHWMVYFASDDPDATAARCVELGGSVPAPPMDIPPGRFAVLADPQGAVFSVMRFDLPVTGD